MRHAPKALLSLLCSLGSLAPLAGCGAPESVDPAGGLVTEDAIEDVIKVLGRVSVKAITVLSSVEVLSVLERVEELAG